MNDLDAWARKRYRSKWGISLLEVLVAIFILLTVLVLTMGFWTACAKYIAQNRAKALGTYVAEQAIENAMALGFEEVDSYVGKRSFSLDATMNGRPFRYAVDYEISVVAINTRLKSIEVTVRWDQQGGEVTYETFLAAEP